MQLVNQDPSARGLGYSCKKAYNSHLAFTAIVKTNIGYRYILGQDQLWNSLADNLKSAGRLLYDRRHLKTHTLD